MIQHIGDHSSKPPTRHVQDWGRNPGMTSCCDKTQGCSIFCSLTQMKQSVCNNLSLKTASHRNQSTNLLHKSIYWLYMTQVPAGSHQPRNSSMEIIKDASKIPQYSKTPTYPDHPQSQIKFSFDGHRGTWKRILILRHDGLFENTLQH